MATVSTRVRLGAWITAGVLGGGLVSGIVVSQLGTATAASPSPSPRASEEPGPGMPFRGQHHPGPGFAPRFGPGLGRDFGPGAMLGGHVLHSEATVVAPDGTTKVVVSQNGDITDIADSTITVKSSDGYLASYTVDKFTRISLNGTDGAMSSLKKGQTVHVMGTKSGATTHAEGIIDGRPMAHPRR